MEFYEFFEKIVGYIPEEFEHLKNICECILPWLFGGFTLATSFVGHFMHKVWNIFFFFGIGFFVPLFIIFVWLQLAGFWFWLVVALCVGIGVLCAVYSHHLHKTKLFITTFLMVYIAVSGYILGLGKFIAVLVGLVIAVVAAVLSIKYKYIMVIITTSFTGSMMFWKMIENKFAANHILILIVTAIMGVAGLAVQCIVEKNELKESYEHMKENGKKAKKIKNKISSKSNSK